MAFQCEHCPDLSNNLKNNQWAKSEENNKSYHNDPGCIVAQHHSVRVGSHPKGGWPEQPGFSQQSVNEVMNEVEHGIYSMQIW